MEIDISGRRDFLLNTKVMEDYNMVQDNLSTKEHIELFKG